MRIIDQPTGRASRLAIVLWLGLLALMPCGQACADAVVLSCWGTVELIQEGKQVNPKGERYSVSITVDLAKKTLMIDDGEPWPITGDTSARVIVSLAQDRGSATLNRTTGAVTIHKITDGLLKFYGACKPAQNLF